MTRVLETRAPLLAFCLVVIASVRIVATYSQLSLTIDEPVHLACGVDYISKQQYRCGIDQPPLTRAMVALGPHLEGGRPTGEMEWTAEGLAVLARLGHPSRSTALMRVGILPFFLLGSLVVYLWACRHFGRAVAVIATGLFTLLPPVLALGGLATTDMGLAACVGAAFFALEMWAELPTWPRSLLLGLAAALAVLTKFTALGYLPAAAAFALLFYVVAKRPTLQELMAGVRERALAFCLAALTGAFVVWSAYGFSYGKPAGCSLRVPAPEFFDGIVAARGHNAEGQSSYLLGQASTKGWWYYFPVVLAVKTPVAFLAFLAWGTFLCLRMRANARYLLPIAFSLGVLLPAMAGNVDTGVRLVLPIYLALSIIAALGVLQVLGSGRLGCPVAGLLAAWMVVAGARQHPDYLAYFNELAGGAPERIVIDSNLDWGQSMKQLAKRLRQLGAKDVSLLEFDGVARFDYLEAWYGMPHITCVDTARHRAGWTAISTTEDVLSSIHAWEGHNAIEPWYHRLAPTERVGGILLYYVPQDLADHWDQYTPARLQPQLRR